MSLLQATNRISDRMNKLVGWVGVGIIIVLLVILYVQVFSRYVLLHAVAWPAERAVILLVWAGFLGASIALKERMHVGVTMLVDLLPETLRKVFVLLVDALAGFFSVYLIISGWQIAVFVGSRQRAPFTDIPYFYLYLSVTVGGVLLLIQCLALLLDDVAKLGGVEKKSVRR